MVNSRAKGKAAELEVAHILQSYGYDTRRGCQFKGGPDSPDVIGVPGLHIEVKRVERLDLDAAMDQSIRDAGEGELPIVVHRRSRKLWKVTMLLDDFMKVWNEGGPKCK